ncbi:MAG: hypothetical protein WBA74_27825, partial [Cyclobacteriaceae bacterium]
MAVKTRNELKNYFRSGNVAKEQYFSHLIDSSVNKADDDIGKGMESGIDLLPSKVGNRFISFFRKSCNITRKLPIFFIELVAGQPIGVETISFTASNPNGKTGRILNLVNLFNKSTKRFSRRVGINTVAPAYTLDVNGVLAAKGVAGTYMDRSIDPSTVIADGEWYSIVTAQNGFRCFEISATMVSSDGHSALTGKTLFVNGEHEDDLLTFPKSGLMGKDKHHLEIRWRKKAKGYDLQIRTHQSVDGKPPIKYKLTRI